MDNAIFWDPEYFRVKRDGVQERLGLTNPIFAGAWCDQALGHHAACFLQGSSLTEKSRLQRRLQAE